MNKISYKQSPEIAKFKKNPCVLFVVNDGWFFKSHRLPVAEALIARGYDVHLAANQDDTKKQIENAGIFCHQWNIRPRNTGVLSEVLSIFSLCKIIIRINPSFLHLVTIKPVLYGGLLSRVLGVPNVIFAISGMGYLFSNKSNSATSLRRIAETLYRLSLGHKNAAIIVQNSEDKNFFITKLKVKESSVFHLPGSGVDVERFTPENRENSPLSVILGARLLWDKGIQEFADAASKLKNKYPEVVFKLLGFRDQDNPRSVDLDSLNRWQEEGILEWQGHSSDMPEELSRAGIFCLPTTYGEGLPKVLLEACACSCAVVASDWPGCREIIVNNQNGLLVPPKDAESLANAIEELINNPTERERLGKNARKTVASNFTIQHVIEQTCSIYTHLSRKI